MSELQLINAAMKIVEMLRSENIVVEQFTDFTKFKKAHGKIRNSTVSGQFRLTKFELYDDNSYWLKFTHKKKCIAVIASRFERLGERTLASHWTDQHSRIYPKPNRIGKHHSKTTFIISGDVVYSGEFVLKGKFTGNGLAAHMVFLNFVLAQLKWQPNWIYGLMSNQLVLRGFAA